MKFLNLVQAVRQAHTALQQEASKAINRSLTIRNWLIGFYIVEFEQKGEDRAGYGINLMDELARKINIHGLSSRNLRLFRLFYLSYPQMEQILSSQLPHFGNNANQIWQTLSAKFQMYENQFNRVLIESHSKEKSSLETPPEKLINKRIPKNYLPAFPKKLNC